MFPIIIDQDIQLRLLTEQDANTLFAIIDCNRDYLRRWLPWLDHSKSVGDSLSFIQLQNTKWQQREALTLGIEFHSQLVGVISFHEIDWEVNQSGIGYWLSENYQNKGIVTRACSALVSFGFEQLKLDKITISCAVENLNSQTIPKKLGFEFQQTIEDKEWLYDHHVSHDIFAMHKADWQILQEKQKVNAFQRQPKP